MSHMVDCNFPLDANRKKCVKCTCEACFTGVDPKKAWYCKECFVSMVRNKFRSALSKRKIFKNTDSRQTLIVFDGSPSAAFLLNQVNEAVRKINFKRLMIEPVILVLVSVTKVSVLNEVLKKIAVLKVILPENIKWYCTHIAFSLKDSREFGEGLNFCNGAEQIKEYEYILSSITSETYRQELKRILKEKSLRNVSRILKIDKIMVPENADDLGRTTLSQLCLGRGGAVSSLTSVIDKRSYCTFIRPLRDVSKKEIGIVNYLCNYEQHAIQIDQNDISSNSIQSLTDKFIVNLEKEKFYSTVNTVLSTAAKIHAPNNEKSPEMCTLCEIEAKTEESRLCATCEVLNLHCSKNTLEFIMQ
ncbi:unnamed protein product [Caenorhabditis bovis]|uniref:Cytoplasmic tRNA 2-thiolation protein 2 n=1 Tax=Caenorhabditis bovis TaxID=2654633 RepID=A0A8S1FAN4_9PELO|nr:unnamed protein product [Caenorhabditis bovis]